VDNGPPAYTQTVVEVIVIVVVALILAIGTWVARRRGYSGIGGNTIVKCRQGHLFTTIWVPGASLKSIRLGKSRFQHCPVGNHWTMVTPVNDSELTDDMRKTAEEHHDVRLP